MSDMNGRVALVTGASSGIGRATAIATDVFDKASNVNPTTITADRGRKGTP
jgi:NADP-dependent 3-hydroxy acid dehydrogenase YdfG